MAALVCSIADGDKKLNVTIEAIANMVAVAIEGCGDYSSPHGAGTQIILECVDGIPRLVVWADINQEGPTHIIDLSMTMENNRKNT